MSAAFDPDIVAFDVEGQSRHGRIRLPDGPRGGQRPTNYPQRVAAAAYFADALMTALIDHASETVEQIQLTVNAENPRAIKIGMMKVNVH